MQRNPWKLWGALCLAAAALAQAPQLQFEVATIKPAPPVTAVAAQFKAGTIHAGMNIDGARVDIGFMSLADLITAAYKIKPFQITGPDWIKQERFDILAKMPDGATTEQVPEMLQSLLAERFKLAIHRENKDQNVYALVVGKNGPKMKESAPEEPAAPATGAPEAAPGPGGRGPISIGTPDGRMTIQPNGRGAVITGGRVGMGSMRMNVSPNGGMRMEMSQMTMPTLADMLVRFMDRPVVDMTELKGKYDVALDLPMEELLNMARAMAPAAGIPGGPGGGGVAGPGGPTGLAGVAASDPSGSSMFKAVQDLGLKLDPRKAPLETIVIDHIEKTPTEN
jgi:uncharacterized protein (TIGR03435 family)